MKDVVKLFNVHKIGLSILFFLVILLQPYSQLKLMANGVPLTVPVIPVIQQKSNWCWAASAQMAGKSLNSSSTRTQSQIVFEVKGHTNNDGGTLNETRRGTEWVSYYKEPLTYIGHNLTTGRLNTSQIESHIYRRYPVAAAAGYYTGTTRTSGHVVVIYGVHYTEGPQGIIHNIMYTDPANGRVYTCTYNNFCNGNFNGRKYDGTIFVVY